MANITNNTANNNEMKHEMNHNQTTTTTTAESTTTTVITKIILDFDDALFPSHRYKAHEILKYHEQSSSEPVQTGRECFKDKEPSFMQLKKKIDLICFKLMQRYSKDNFVILSTGDYQWIESTLGYYEYLLSAYNIQIYSTQQWAKTHPTDFNVHGSLSAKSFLMKMLLQKWRNEAQQKYNGVNTTIKFRLISIGDSFFEFLGCYNIGYDYVNRIKLLEEPSVDQMSGLWDRVLYLCRDSVYDANIVFVNENEYYELDEDRMKTLNEQCIARINNTATDTVFDCSLLDVITLDNSECFEIVTDENGEQYKHRKQQTVKVQCIPEKVQTDGMDNEAERYTIGGVYNNNNINSCARMNQNPYHDPNTRNNNNLCPINYTSFVPLSPVHNPLNHHVLYCQQQQLLYAQQWLQQQQQEVQSQFLLDVPQLSQYTNLNYTDAGYGPMHYAVPNTIMTANYMSNT